MKKEIGLYIHIPFCKSKCYYCDFISYQNKEELLDDYINALIKEIKYSKLEKYNIKTIYIGGGTPSILESKHIWEILKNIKPYIEKNAEITIEVNPGTINEKKLEEYIKFGINRISIGLQSTDNNLLKQIGRIHNLEEFLKTYKIAKKVGFNNINVDLILGLPNQTLEILKNSISNIIELQPEHISIYSLILEEGTKLYDMVNKQEIRMIDEELERLMYWEAKKMLEANGYIHYEISNFAKDNFQSKHNLDCWNQKEYIGIGVAAHSYIENTRKSNTASIENYIDNINKERFVNNITIHEKQTKVDMRKRIYAIRIKKNTRN